MRRIAALFPLLFAFASSLANNATVSPEADADAATLQAIYGEALSRGQAYERLRELVGQYPGRLSGTRNMERAVDWAESALQQMGLHRVVRQEVTVPHWVRGEPETAFLLENGDPLALSLLALGGSGATPPEGIVAEVIEVESLDALARLAQADVAGRIVFFNGAMDPTALRPSVAYAKAGPQRTQGPAAAAKLGAVAALVRSLTYDRDDVPHTGMTSFPATTRRIPAAALSTIAADRLSAAVRHARATGTSPRVALKINAHTLPDTVSHNVIGEIRGTEAPGEVILVGGHLDSWDITPGAHDDGCGVVQSIEVMRIFSALGLKPRHTLRCVLFANEENGLGGAAAYAAAAKAAGEKHVFAIESDAGGYEPRGFVLGSTQGNMASRAERWAALFRPYGTTEFREGRGGMDVVPLMAQGATVGALMPDSQRYFEIHHTREDTLDKVNERELQLGAAALAALVYLVDTHGL